MKDPTTDAVPFHVKNFGGKRNTSYIDCILVVVIKEKLTDVLQIFDKTDGNISTNFVVGEGENEVIETVEYKELYGLPPRGGMLGSENLASILSICIASPAGELSEYQVQSLIPLMSYFCGTYFIPLNRVFPGENAANLPWYDILNTLGSILVGESLRVVGEEEEKSDDI